MDISMVATRRRIGRTLVVMTGFGLALAGLTGPSTATTTTTSGDPGYSEIKFVQANISKDESIPDFDHDVAEVFAQAPDIVTFNEVYARDSKKLAPSGYSIFRTPGIRTGWAPVVWKTSEWTAFDQGTVKISDRVKNRPGIVGLRYANWVSLRNAEGQVVSVISTHVAPNEPPTDRLLVPSLERLAALATKLGVRGAVMMGGDFNMGYHSDRYQPQYLKAAGLMSTYDLMGSSFPTHRLGGTIDYLWLGPVSHFFVNEQYPVVMKSDHRMLVVRLQLMSGPAGADPPAFSPGVTLSTPTGTKAQRRAARILELQAIQAAPSGSAIHVASSKIRGTAVFAALTAAADRGVDVTVVSGEPAPNDDALALRALLGHDRSQPSFYAVAPNAWTSGSLPQTLLLVSRAGATPALGLTADTPMGLAPMHRHYPTRTRVTVTTDKAHYDSYYSSYLSAVGRNL